LEAIECIRKRRSVRAFEDQPVSDDIVEEVLESARMAPSAANRQEWAFVVVRRKEIKKRILEAIVEIETTITQPAWKRLQVGGAPLEALARDLGKMTGRDITVDNIRDQKDLSELLKQYTRQGIVKMFNADVLIAVYRKASEEACIMTPNMYDTGAAIQNMLLTATSRGLSSLWAGGFARRDIRREYRASGTSVRDFYRDPISEILHAPQDMDLAALVFIGKGSHVPSVPPRKPLNEVAFLDEYGNPWKKGSERPEQ
jgi:nitroreductase